MVDKPKRLLFYLMSQSKAHLSCLELKFAISLCSTRKKVSMRRLFDDPLVKRARQAMSEIKADFPY